MHFKSINPFNGECIAHYEAINKSELQQKLNAAHQANMTWRKTELSERTHLMANAAKVLRENVEDYARMITLEMGKPITESRAEVNKCAWVCDYYAENADTFLKDEWIKTDASQSFVRHDPIGTILAIMPWNFPFWQVFRFAAPALTAGNTALLKHAPNVFGCAIKIEEVFHKAGFPKDVFQSIIISHEVIEDVIAHDVVQAVTLTGSERAGSAVAALAGKYIKKTVLELGGNNAFIVCADADIDQAVKTALTARMLNCGQSCIAAKRFILLDKIHDEFVQKFTREISQLRKGNPLDESTQLGPLARLDLADQLQRQVKESMSKGAELLVGGTQDHCFHEPTVLAQVRPGMPAFDEETFGPLAGVIRVKDEVEAVELAGQSRYGLGLTICTKDTDKALALAAEFSDAAVFINELVKSDPRLPFGGTKLSGYGRELSKDGMMEFINRKTVYVK